MTDLERLSCYIAIVPFISAILGPDYEVAVSVLGKSPHVIAIANGYITKREVGTPLKLISKKYIINAEADGRPIELNYRAISSSGSIIYSNTYYIRDDSGHIIGLFCVNAGEDSINNRFEAAKQLFYPWLVGNERDNIFRSYFDSASTSQAVDPESISGVVKTLLQKYKTENLITIMTLEDKKAFVKYISEQGIFDIRSSVKAVSIALDCSEPTVYRYLSSAKSEA